SSTRWQTEMFRSDAGPSQDVIPQPVRSDKHSHIGSHDLRDHLSQARFRLDRASTRIAKFCHEFWCSGRACPVNHRARESCASPEKSEILAHESAPTRRCLLIALAHFGLLEQLGRSNEA